jgi:PTH1 family peptidyl-tRNA hydrolase
MAGGEDYLMGTGTYEEAGFFIVKPVTHMNASGMAVARIVEERSLALDRLLVVCDDCHLPLGKIRIRRSGSDGGHRGLTSVIDFLHSKAFPRLRIGIGSPPPEVEMIDYVLGKFSKEEEVIMGEAVGQATEAVLSFLRDGLDKTMDIFNRPKR